MFGNFILRAFQTLSLTKAIQVQRFSTVLNKTSNTPHIAGGSWAFTQIRHKIRNRWPRPSEAKRIKALGYKKRMSTLHGRKIIMRRILAGRWILSH